MSNAASSKSNADDDSNSATQTQLYNNGVRGRVSSRSFDLSGRIRVGEIHFRTKHNAIQYRRPELRAHPTRRNMMKAV